MNWVKLMLHATNWGAVKRGVAHYYGRPNFDDELLEDIAQQSMMGDICPVFNRLTGEYEFDGEPDVDTPVYISAGQLIFYLE